MEHHEGTLLVVSIEKDEDTEEIYEEIALDL